MIFETTESINGVRLFLFRKTVLGHGIIIGHIFIWISDCFGLRFNNTLLHTRVLIDKLFRREDGDTAIIGLSIPEISEQCSLGNDYFMETTHDFQENY